MARLEYTDPQFRTQFRKFVYGIYPAGASTNDQYIIIHKYPSKQKSCLQVFRKPVDNHSWWFVETCNPIMHIYQIHIILRTQLFCHNFNVKFNKYFLCFVYSIHLNKGLDFLRHIPYNTTTAAFRVSVSNTAGCFFVYAIRRIFYHSIKHLRK